MPAAASEHREADVVLDVEFERGLLFLVLENLGGAPAHTVRVRFESPLTGLGGERRIDRLQIFRRLEFLGPDAGSASSSTAPRSSSRARRTGAVSARVSWRTDDGARRSRTIRHDLAAYRDFPYLEVPDDA